VIELPPGIQEYAEAHTTPPTAAMQALAQETLETLEAPQMLSGPVEGRFLETLIFALRPKLVLDIGTFSGYSALSMAAGLAPGGRVITCDVNPKAVEVARRHIEASPYADRIDVRVGPALDTIATLNGPFDFVFIDADKPNYSNYYDAVLPKLADDGMIAADNTLWGGQVVDRSDTSENTEAIRAFNDKVRDDPRVVCVQLTVRDGITLIRKA
jgi:caffeoyl-CoA O-methyltransferase